jgi:tetratricopeptide (TPR) repeat protein
MLGSVRYTELRDTYHQEEIDKTLDSLTAAAQMPDNFRVIDDLSRAHLVAADIYRLQGDEARHQFHLRKAKQEAHRLLETRSDHALSHVANAWIAIYEERWEDAVTCLRTADASPEKFDSWYHVLRFHLPHILYRLGRYEEALVELDAMSEGPRGWLPWHRDRLVISAEIEGIDSAEVGLRQWLETINASPRLLGIHRMPYAVYCFLGQPREAIRFSREYLKKAGPPSQQRESYVAVEQYICGEISADALLAAASRRIDRMYAHYLVGMTSLAHGDRTEAMWNFAEVERRGNYALTGSFSCSWAHLFLKRLREDPTWPPWIPVREESTTQPDTSHHDNAKQTGDSL